MTARGRRRLEPGFTLIELAVDMAVLMVVLMIASGLLIEAVRIFSNSGREMREPGAELALRLLRLDLHASQPLAGVTIPEYGALECIQEDRTERWELIGERLVRHGFTAAGEDEGARPMIDQVLSFSWRTPWPGLVQVEIVRRKPSGLSALRASTAAWRSSSESLEAATVVAGSRIASGP